MNMFTRRWMGWLGVVAASVLAGCAAQTAKPTVAATKPAVTLIKPATPAAKAAVATTKPAAAPAKPAAEAVKPAEAAKPAAAAVAPADGKLVWGFEALDPRITEGDETCPLTIVKDPALVTQGQAAMKLVCLAGSNYPGLRITDGKLLADWNKYTTAMLDVRNLSAVEVPLGVRLDDANSEDEENRYDEKHLLKPGLNTITLDLRNLTAPSGRKTDVSTLQGFILYVSHPTQESTLIFDNLRLAGPITAPAK